MVIGLTAGRRGWKRRVQTIGALTAVAALVLAACGVEDPDETIVDEDTPADADEMDLEQVRQISGAIPFPGGIPFFPILVAQERGYLADEGIELTNVEPLDGSGAVVQQIAAGQVESPRPGAGPGDDLAVRVHLAAVPQVKGQVHCCHATRAELALDAVAVGEGCRNPGCAQIRPVSGVTSLANLLLDAATVGPAEQGSCYGFAATRALSSSNQLSTKTIEFGRA